MTPEQLLELRKRWKAVYDTMRSTAFTDFTDERKAEITAEFDGLADQIEEGERVLERANKLAKLEREQEASSEANNARSFFDSEGELLERYQRQRSAILKKIQLRVRLMNPGTALDSLSTDDFILLNTRTKEEKLFYKFIRVGYAGLSHEEHSAFRNYLKQRAEANTMTTGNDATGGTLVPEVTATMVFADSAIYGPMADLVGRTNLVTPTGGDIPFPTFTDTDTRESEKIAENADWDPTVFATGKVTLGAYKYTTGVALPYELLEDAVIDLEPLLRQFMAEAQGRKLNKEFTLGTGANNPQGVATLAAARRVVISDKTKIGWDDVVDLIHKVDAAYRARAFLMFHDNLVAGLRKMKDSNNRPIWTPSTVLGEPDRINGYPIRVNNALDTTTNTATSKVGVFLDPDSYVVRRVGTMRVVRDDSFLRGSDQILIVNHVRADGRFGRVKGGANLYGKA